MRPSQQESLRRYEAARAHAENLTRRRTTGGLVEVTVKIVFFLALVAGMAVRCDIVPAPGTVKDKVIYGMNGEAKYRAQVALRGEVNGCN